MDILLVSIVALLASGLTLFSGFGLGTLLMPVIALFFPIEMAIAMTAVVHFANNGFKAILIGRFANRSVLLRFGIPAVIFAILGALLLAWLSARPTLIEYAVLGHGVQVPLVKLLVGLLILLFVALELIPGFAKLALDQKFLPLGGVVSGFFGGVSGHQGAFRSMFLLKAGLSKEAFVATGVMLAIMVDIARMTIYGFDMTHRPDEIAWGMVGAATLSAFVGAYFGAKLLHKVTIRLIQIVVSVMLSLIALGMIFGIL